MTLIIGPVLTMTVFSALVAYTASKGYRMVQTSSVVPLLSVVVCHPTILTREIILRSIYYVGWTTPSLSVSLPIHRF